MGRTRVDAVSEAVDLCGVGMMPWLLIGWGMQFGGLVLAVLLFVVIPDRRQRPMTKPYTNCRRLYTYWPHP